jgi:hypothetical protein
MPGHETMHRPAAPTAAVPERVALSEETAMARSPEPPRPDQSRGGAYDPAWNTLGRNAGYLTGAAFFLTTLLFLLDATDVLAPSPKFQVTSAGPLQDLATYFVRFFAHQHQMLWDIALRDTLGPIAYVGLIVLVVAVANVVGWRRAGVQLMVLLVVLGGVLAATGSLTYLAEIEYWQATGWTADPAANMVAVGHASDAIAALTVYPEVAGFGALAVGLLYFARFCRTQEELPSRLSPLVYAESLALLGAGVAEAVQRDVVYDILALVTGAVVAPVIAIWVGINFGRLEAVESGRGPLAA